MSHSGLISLARGCIQLEYLLIDVFTNIRNKGLDCIGVHLKNLSHFQLIFWNREDRITMLPLDIGVRSLLIGCRKLKKLNISLIPGGLTDAGLGYIGKYGRNLRHLRLRNTGETDAGLINLSKIFSIVFYEIFVSFCF